MKHILKQPVLTEKSIKEYRDSKRVSFEVEINSNKNTAMNELANEYSVKVLSANTVNRLGKYKMNRRNGKKIKFDDKKIMTFKLDKNSKIDIFENNLK